MLLRLISPCSVGSTEAPGNCQILSLPKARLKIPLVPFTVTLAAFANLTRQLGKHRPGTPESYVPWHKGKNSLLKIMIISFYFHCSHSLKQKVDSLFTTSIFPMSTDVSYSSVVKDTAPLLSPVSGTAWLC